MYQQQRSTKVVFNRQRDFGKIFTDAFKFFKYNFKNLLGAVLLISGPLFLIMGGISGYMQATGNDIANMFSMRRVMNRSFMSDFDISEFLFVMLIYWLVSIIAYVIYAAIVNRYLILSQQKEEGEKITIAEIMRYLPADAWRLFYNYLLLGLVAIAFVIGMVVVMLIPILGVLAIIVGLLLMGPNLIYALTNAPYLVLKEEILITQAFSKSWRYMRRTGNYWWTWVIIVVTYMIVSIASFIFALPQFILTMVSTFSRLRFDQYGDYSDDGSGIGPVWFIVCAMITVLGQHLLMPLLSIFTVLNYHSHEEEEEGTGLMQRIDEIGGPGKTN
jgi:hypothetical protein